MLRNASVATVELHSVYNLACRHLNFLTAEMTQLIIPKSHVIELSVNALMLS